MVTKNLAKIIGMGMLSLIPMNLGSVREANAGHIMIVDDIRVDEEISVLGEPKTVSRYEYNVTNNDAPLTEPINYFEISAGLNEGVLSSDAPFGWNTTIGNDLTSFTTNASNQMLYSISSFPKTFALYVDDVGETSGVGYANARTPDGVSYDQDSIDVPIPEPNSGALACLGLFGCGAYGASRMLGRRKEDN